MNILRKQIQKINRPAKLRFIVNSGTSATSRAASAARVVGAETIPLSNSSVAIIKDGEIVVVSKKPIYIVDDASELFKNTAFTSIDLRNVDTSKMTSASGMFQDCSATEINLSEFNTSNVTNMARMFCNCCVKELNLSSFDTSKVYNMEHMFNACPANKIDVSNFDTSNVVYMSGMLRNISCDIIGLENFDTSRVENMGTMFANTKTDTLNISSFRTRRVKNMYSMFASAEINNLIADRLVDRSTTCLKYMFTQANIGHIDTSKWSCYDSAEIAGMFVGAEIDELELRNMEAFRHNYNDAFQGVFRNSKIGKIKLRNNRECKLEYYMHFLWSRDKYKDTSFEYDEYDSEQLFRKDLFGSAYVPPAPPQRKHSDMKTLNINGVTKCDRCFGKVENGKCTCCGRVVTGK